MSNQAVAEVAEIVAAANLIRQRAQAILNDNRHGGRWQVKRFGEPTGRQFYIQSDQERHLLVTDLFYEADAEHLAGFDPTAALAIATWLEAVVAQHSPVTEEVTYSDGKVESRLACRYCAGQFDCGLAVWPCRDVQPALVFARAYLRTGEVATDA